MSDHENTDSGSADRRAQLNAEMARTAFQRKAVSRKPPNEVIDEAIAFFKERGYRAGRTGRPNQMFIMGGREGKLPRVTAEILVQGNVGKAKTTMLSISGFGEELSTHLQSYTDYLRAQRKGG